MCGLARLCQWLGFLSEERVEDGCGGLLDNGKRFGEQFSVAVIETDVVRAGTASIQTHGAANDECDGLCLGLAYRFGCECAAFCPVQHLVAKLMHQCAELLGLRLAGKQSDLSAVADALCGCDTLVVLKLDALLLDEIDKPFVVGANLAGNPELFFDRTFITEGMRLLLDSVIRRLAGRGGDPVIQLQTAFGGGKTHTMLAVYHLANRTVPVSKLSGISPILDAAGVTDLPKAKVVVLDGTRFSPSQPKQYGDQKIKTLWGEMAWQLGGAAAFAAIAESDENGTAPDASLIEKMLEPHQPVVLLMDELVAYLRQFEDGRGYAGGTFESNLTFIQNLTQAFKGVPRAIMLVSLPASKVSEAGSARGKRAMDQLEGALSLTSLEKTVGRVHALWKPVGTEEAFEIVRRRLFTQIKDGAQATATCRAFADTYAENREDMPKETLEGRYLDRMERAYPIHPEVFDRLYEDWSSLDNFQRTRGVLKLMAIVRPDFQASRSNSAYSSSVSRTPICLLLA